jgi:hypothetical protein
LGGSLSDLFLGSRHKAAQGILFAASAIAAVTGIVLLSGGWSSWGEQTYLSFGTRMWGWAFIAVLPLCFSVIRLRKSSVPVAVAIVFCHCAAVVPASLDGDYETTAFITTPMARSEPNLAAHALVAAFCVFLVWWGVHHASRALVNLGIVGFAIAVGWFYFSDIFGAAAARWG